MTDHDRELLKWVAEELLGWKLRQQGPGDYICWIDEKGSWSYGFDLESWHGIGLVVEEMIKRGIYDSLSIKQFRYASSINESGQWECAFRKKQGGSTWFQRDEKPWFAVYGAARKAVWES